VCVCVCVRERERERERERAAAVDGVQACRYRDSSKLRTHTAMRTYGRSILRSIGPS